jgi:DNA-binding transcriptional regulator YhcF (GntR family)
MKLYVDRELPVPLGIQLRGLIEYGIACGELVKGERLPSVRELADIAGVAPMTVSQVYRDLKQAGLIAAQSGSGTFVIGRPQTKLISAVGNDLHRRIDLLIEEGLAMGLRPSGLVALVSARIFFRTGRAAPTQIMVVGMFQAATARYARLISAHLGAVAAVDAVTLEAIEREDDLRAQAAAADLVVTFANRRREVEELLGTTRVVAISFIPSEETRLALASLDPLAKVAIVSRFPEFLPIMKSGVQRFAPHAQRTCASVLDSGEIAAAITEADVIIYETGAEVVVDRLRPGTPAIEYRHIPDPADIEGVIVPLIRGAESNVRALEREAS